MECNITLYKGLYYTTAGLILKDILLVKGQQYDINADLSDLT